MKLWDWKPEALSQKPKAFLHTRAKMCYDYRRWKVLNVWNVLNVRKVLNVWKEKGSNTMKTRIAILMLLAALAAGMAQAYDDGTEITFVSDGDTVDTRYLYPGEQLGALPSPTKPGFELVGWFDSDDHQVTETTRIEELRSHTINAHWREEKHTITFVSEGNTVDTSELYPEQPLGTLPSVSRPGYDLLGWFDSNDQQVSAATLVSALPSDIISAQWRELPPPSVSNVVARQRWPWNGLVDIDYEVGGYTAGLEALIEVADAEGGRSWQVTNFLAGAEPSVEVGFHRATWDTTAAGLADVVASNAVATVSLVRFTPHVERLTVAGESGILVPERENRFVSKLDPSGVSSPSVAFSLAGQEKALPVKAYVEYVNSGDERAERREEFQVGRTDASIALGDGIAPNSTVSVTFSYKDLPQSETDYSFVFDSVAPSLAIAGQLASDYRTYQGGVFTSDSTPDFHIAAAGETDWDQIAWEIADPDNGIWIVVTDNQTDVFRRKLTNTDGAHIQNDDFSITLPRLRDGTHTLEFFTEDLAGNRTPGFQTTLTIDTTVPRISVEGYDDYGSGSMQVDQNQAGLAITVSDDNLCFETSLDCVSMTSNRGQMGLISSVTATDTTLVYDYVLTLELGSNVWTFTVVDAAGNQAIKQFVYEYNDPDL